MTDVRPRWTVEKARLVRRKLLLAAVTDEEADELRAIADELDTLIEAAVNREKGDV